jgi:hypothetical protein
MSLQWRTAVEVCWYSELAKKTETPQAFARSISAKESSNASERLQLWARTRPYWA